MQISLRLLAQSDQHPKVFFFFFFFFGGGGGGFAGAWFEPIVNNEGADQP